MFLVEEFAAIFYDVRNVIYVVSGFFCRLVSKKARDKLLVFKTSQDLTPSDQQLCNHCHGRKCLNCVYTGKSNEALVSFRQVAEYQRIVDAMTKETKKSMRQARLYHDAFLGLGSPYRDLIKANYELQERTIKMSYELQKRIIKYPK